MKMSLDGADFRPPLMMRLFAPLIKKRLLRGPMTPGFKLPAAAAKELVPETAVSTEQGLNELRSAIDRLNREPNRAPQPGVRPNDARGMGPTPFAPRGVALELFRAG